MNVEQTLSSDIQELLDSTPLLTQETIQTVADANHALNLDSEHIAGVIKAVFVNDILSEMENQNLNRNQLAKVWGKSRQHISKILDKEKSKNFTIDTIVSLSMALGLRPQCIQLEPIEEVAAQATMTWESSEIVHKRILPIDWCQHEECSCVDMRDVEEAGNEELVLLESDLIAA